MKFPLFSGIAQNDLFHCHRGSGILFWLNKFQAKWVGRLIAFKHWKFVGLNPIGFDIKFSA
jgi:hypothetical protein